MSGLHRVLAFDPGGTTGMAVWGGYEDGSHDFISSQMPKPWEEWLAKLERDVFAEHPPQLVVVERFTITANTLQKAREPDALYIIGALKLLAHKYGIDFELQSPGDAKRFCTDARLKKAGWWKSTPGGHANDAARHLFLALAKRGLIDVLAVDRADG